MKQQDILRKVGNMQQLAYIRPLTYTDGRSRGMSAFDMKNGPLSFQVLADKCLDIGQFSYKGVNFSFLSKPGLQGRGHYDTNGQEAGRSIMGGLMFTAGFENICAPYGDYPMHGRIRTTPAEHVAYDASWENDHYVMRLSGRMREATLFGENLTMHRTIETIYGEDSFLLRDEITNESFRDETLMLLYHINIGYPLLDEGTQVFLQTEEVSPRDETSAPHIPDWGTMGAPIDNETEYVFLHKPMPDANGNVTVQIFNKQLEMGLKITYAAKYLPYFMEWKSVASGDYVIGLEPANSSVYGRKYHEERGDLHTIRPFETETNEIRFEVIQSPPQ